MLNLNLNQRVFKGRKEPKQTGKRVQNKLSKSLMARYLDPSMFPNNTMGFRITMVDQMSLCCHGKSFSDSILTSRSHGMIVIIHCCNDSLITVAVMHLSMLQWSLLQWCSDYCWSDAVITSTWYKYTLSTRNFLICGLNLDKVTSTINDITASLQ